jgi:hypothetical protein
LLVDHFRKPAICEHDRVKLAGVAQLPSESVMSALRLMSPPHSQLRGQSSQNSAQSSASSIQYRSVQGCTVSKPGWQIDSRPGIGLQFLSQGLISSIGSLSQHLERLGKQLISSGRSSMVADNQIPRLRLAGRWNKDKSASDMDGYGKSLDLMGIHGALLLTPRQPPACAHPRTHHV